MKSEAKTPIVALQDYDESTNLMIYGDSGVGKTVVAGSAPRALFVASEPGTISAKRRGSKANLWPCHTWEDFEAATKWLEDGGYQNYQWAINDSWTSLQSLAWKFLLKKGLEKSPGRDEDLPEIQEHFKMHQMLRRVSMKWVGMPLNTLHLAQTMTVNSADGEELIFPQVNGKEGAIAQFIMGQMSSIGHAVVEENDAGKNVHRIYWDYDPPHAGRDRYDCLGPYTDNITIPRIMERINNSGETPRKRKSTRSSTKRSGTTTTTRKRRTRRNA